MKQFLGEIQALTTADNQVLALTGSVYTQAFSGYGAPPVQWISRKGYLQAGQTAVGYSVDSRTISLTVTTERQVSREDFWLEREKLLNIFRPNRGLGIGNELTLTLIRMDGSRRAIKCFYAGGLELDGDSENNFLINGNIQLVCFNPIWYDPTVISISPESDVDDNLVFPITFPIQFGLAGNVFFSGDLAYEGTWRSYPTISLTGAYTSATLENTGTGVTFQLGVAIGAGESRIITLSEEGFIIVDQAGVNRFNELVSGANLVGFNIRPNSEIESGTIQQLKATLVNGSAEAGVTFEYTEKYFGI